MAGVDMTFSSDQNEWLDVLVNLKADISLASAASPRIRSDSYTWTRSVASLAKDRRFNAGLQWRMLCRTGWAVIWRSERGPAPGGALSRGGPGGRRGLKGEPWGWCPVPGRECACASRGAATGRNRRESAYQLTRWSNSTSGRGSPRANLSPSRVSKSSSQGGRRRVGRCAVPGWARRGRRRCA